MIDWITCVIPVQHKIIMGGGYINHDSDGEVISHGLKKAQFRGTYESSIQVKTQQLSECGNYGAELYLDGNPSKFLQGHNVVGTDDIITLVLLTVEHILNSHGQQLDELSRRRILAGDFALYRVDINYSYELNSYSDVSAWIQAASVQSKTRHGKPQLVKSTLYWGKGSTVWMMKAYSKFEELTTAKKRQRLPKELVNTPLLPFSENKLRLELQLRKELKKIAQQQHSTEKFYAKYLPPSRCREIFNDYLERIEMANNFSVKDATLLDLPSALRGTYEIYRQGFDVKSMMSKPTFYRHRRQLIELIDVDISLPRTDVSERSNVVALVRPLEAKPVAIPDDLHQYVIGL